MAKTIIHPQCVQNALPSPHSAPNAHFSQLLGVGATDAWFVNRITTHLDRAVELIMATPDEVQVRQQRLISLLMDVLLQQPDHTVIGLIVGTLNRHGITAYQFVPTANAFDPRRTFISPPREASGQTKMIRDGTNYIHKNERCLVRLGPIVLELKNDGGYADLLRGARDLCELKHNHYFEEYP